MTDDRRPIHFIFEVGDHGPTDLLVTSFRGAEGVSELFRFEIELASEDAEIDFEAVVGHAGKLVWSEADGDRYVHGMVSTFETTGFGHRFARYRAILVPSVWPLTLKRRSRIYEEVAVPEILRRVLEADGISADRFHITASEDHPVREYCVQYGESDWDFLARLMEDEGFVYFFRHKEDGAVLEIDDRRENREAIEGDPTVAFRDPGTGVAPEGQIWQLHARREVRPTTVRLRDYDFRHPSAIPNVEYESAGEPAFPRRDLFDYEYPGGLVETAVDGPLPGFRLDALRARKFMLTAESNVARLRPGHRFTLDGHHRDDFNVEFQIIRVVHDGSQEQAAQEEAAEEGHTVYHNSLECVPATAFWRAHRGTPRPRVHGPQTARVVGPAGEEIHTDEFGRIRVEFHWNCHDGHNDGSSCWIRVGQSWAGAGWGAFFLPRIGHEVVVQFLEGDPDRPLVIGSVYNGANPPPYALPGEKTKSTIKSDSSLGGGGFNELRFEDAKGSEEVFLHAEKDWNTIVLNDNTETVGHDQTRKVGHDQKLQVGNNREREVGNDEKVLIKNHRSKDILGGETIMVVGYRSAEIVGDETLAVTVNRDKTVGGDETAAITGSRSVKVEVDQTIAVGGNLKETVAGNATQDISKDDKISVGGNLVLSVNADETVSITGMGSVDVGKDGSLKIGKKLKVEVGNEVSIVCGDAKLTMKKNGDITIKGKNIKIDGSGNLTLKGSKIAAN